MRYEVGQEVYVISFSYETDKFTSLFPLLYNDDQPTKIFVEKLTVTEHHKVSWDQDPKDEKKYDGFVLTREDGTIWHNQFPYASYGQTSSTADYVFTFNPNFSETGKELEAKWKALLENESNFPTKFEELTVNYGRINRGIADFKAACENKDPESDQRNQISRVAKKLERLEELRDNILKAFEEKFPTKQIDQKEEDYSGYKLKKFVIKDK